MQNHWRRPWNWLPVRGQHVFGTDIVRGLDRQRPATSRDCLRTSRYTTQQCVPFHTVWRKQRRMHHSDKMHARHRPSFLHNTRQEHWYWLRVYIPFYLRGANNMRRLGRQQTPTNWVCLRSTQYTTRYCVPFLTVWGVRRMPNSIKMLTRHIFYLHSNRRNSWHWLCVQERPVSDPDNVRRIEGPQSPKNWVGLRGTQRSTWQYLPIPAPSSFYPSQPRSSWYMPYSAVVHTGRRKPV
jgi:hypothetical protein